MAKLGEICTIVSGTTPKSSNPTYWDGDVNWVTPAELTDETDVIYESKRKITQQAVKETNLKSFPAGTVLLSSRAPIGKVAIAGTEMYCNQGFKNLICSEAIYNRYLYYFLKDKTEYLNSLGRGATFKEISKSIVEDIDIPLPTVEEQHHRVEKLDAISNLIEKRKQQLNKFDVLVKSRFIEMFGATDRFEEVPLHDSVEEMHIGPFGSSLKNECFVEVDQSYCMVYEQKHAIRKTMDVDTRYVDEKKYKELRRFTVQGGDIIVSCRGTIGETFIIPEDAPFGIMHPSIMKIRVKPNEYNRVFFNHLLQNVLERHEAAANGSGVKMAITATALGKERFIKPPMKLQLEYSDFVAQVDKSKLVAQKSLEQLDILKKALMQEYFG